LEISSVMVQQASEQLKSTVALLKQSAKNNGSAVQLVEQAVQSSTTATRGQNLDITV